MTGFSTLLRSIAANSNFLGVINLFTQWADSIFFLWLFILAIFQNVKAFTPRGIESEASSKCSHVSIIMFILFDKDKVYAKQISTVYRYNAALLAATQILRNDKLYIGATTIYR